MAQITVLFFAHFKERAGVNRLALDFTPPLTVAGLKSLLAARFPALQPAMPGALVSINQEFAFDTDPLPDRAEVGLFPPVSGGSPSPTIVRVTEETLDLNELVALITLPTTGAACVFTGVVRGETLRGDFQHTSSLEYEAYTPMAHAKMLQVVEEIRSRWPAMEGIAVVQRVGHLLPGTPTTIIACTAAHRDTGVFEAARYGIDRLKEIVPIWKKEIGPNGETWVDGHYHPVEEDKNG